MHRSRTVMRLVAPARVLRYPFDVVASSAWDIRAPAAQARIATAIAVAALLVRLAYALALAPARGGPLLPDEQVYDALGWNLASSGELAVTPGAPTAQREPLYPLFLAAVYTVAGHRPLAALLVQAALGAFAALLVFLIARRLTGPRAALAASALTAFHPPLVYFGGRLLREVLVTVLLLGAVLALLAAADGQRGRTGRSWLLAGALLGLGATAASALAAVFAAAVPAAALVAGWRRGALPFACGFLLALAPWAGRNAVVFQTLIAGSTNGGKTFWDGTDKIPFEARGLPDEARLLADHPDIIAAAALPDEVSRERHFYRRTFAFIGERPGHYLALTGRKFLKFWRPWPHAGRDYGHSRALAVLTGALVTAPILLLGAAGALLLPPGRTWPLIVPIVGLTLVYSLFWSQVRYRLPLEPLFIVLATATVARFFAPPSGASLPPQREPGRRRRG